MRLLRGVYPELCEILPLRYAQGQNDTNEGLAMTSGLLNSRNLENLDFDIV